MEDLLFLLKKKYPSLSLCRFHLNRVVNYTFRHLTSSPRIKIALFSQLFITV